jgi:hypothetical protein
MSEKQGFLSGIPQAIGDRAGVAECDAELARISPSA